MTGDLKKIAVLGASSHIARSLLGFFETLTDARLFLFGRNEEKIRRTATVDLENPRVRVFNGFDAFENEKYDFILNCVGAGVPSVLGKNYVRWFTLTEEFDNKILSYLSKISPETLYVNFSSGAIYGTSGRPCAENSVFSVAPNRLEISDFYTIARLNAEAKHRAFDGLRIADIRIFSYFSRFAGLDDGYFMTDVLKALKTRDVLHTKSTDMERDFIAPRDLFSLILCIAKAEKINESVDAYSKKSVLKSDIIKTFESRFGLKTDFNGVSAVSPNGVKNVYVSVYKAAEKFGWAPQKTSVETLVQETAAALEG